MSSLNTELSKGSWALLKGIKSREPRNRKGVKMKRKWRYECQSRNLQIELWHIWKAKVAKRSVVSYLNQTDKKLILEEHFSFIMMLALYLSKSWEDFHIFLIYSKKALKNWYWWDWKYYKSIYKHIDCFNLFNGQIIAKSDKSRVDYDSRLIFITEFWISRGFIVKIPVYTCGKIMF